MISIMCLKYVVMYVQLYCSDTRVRDVVLCQMQARISSRLREEKKGTSYYTVYVDCSGIVVLTSSSLLLLVMVMDSPLVLDVTIDLLLIFLNLIDHVWVPRPQIHLIQKIYYHSLTQEIQK